MALFMENDKAPEAWKAAEDDADLLGLKSMMEEPPEETAELMKEQGNMALKKGKKHYRIALKYYTDAIECKGNIANNNSVYYANRAHVEILLGNYGRALKDSETAIQLNPENVKAYYRASKAALMIGSFQVTIGHCKNGLLHDPQNEELKKVLQQSEDKLRDITENEQKIASIKAASQLLAGALRHRSIRMGRALYKEHTGGKKPWLDASGLLHWPVVLLYPESMTSDIVEDFCETDLLVNHIDVMFGEEAPPLLWDKDHQYRRDTVEVYFQTNSTEPLKYSKVAQSLVDDQGGVHLSFTDDNIENDEDPLEGLDWSERGEKKWVQMGKRESLSSVLSRPGHTLPGLPVFFVVAKQTTFRDLFLSGSWTPP